MTGTALRQQIPGPRGAEAWRALRGVARDPLRVYSFSRKRYGDIVFFPGFRGASWLFVAHPDMVARVHQGNHRNYCRGSLSEPFAMFLGNGLLTSERETWAIRRRAMAPAFRPDYCDGRVSSVTQAECARLLDRWEAISDSALDICDDLERLTFRIVLDGLFSIDLADQEHTVLEQLTSALVYVSDESFRMYPLLAPVAARRRARFDRTIQRLNEAMTAVVRRRIRDGQRRGDLLDLLIEADLGPDAIRDELLTMLHAGQHTVASSIEFALYLLAEHESIAERLHTELGVLDGKPPSPEDISRVPFLHQVMLETMRLYPPAWGGVRETIDNDELGGYQIPGGMPVVFSQFVTHRHPDFWSDPEKFIPDRFAEDARRAMHRYAYFPFGGGPHLCIGQDIGLLEAATIVAMIVQRFRLRRVPGTTARPRALLDLVPADGVILQFSARGGSVK